MEYGERGWVALGTASLSLIRIPVSLLSLVLPQDYIRQVATYPCYESDFLSDTLRGKNFDRWVVLARLPMKLMLM